jgi:hypothetical protein
MFPSHGKINKLQICFYPHSPSIISISDDEKHPAPPIPPKKNLQLVMDQAGRMSRRGVSIKFEARQNSF